MKFGEFWKALALSAVVAAALLFSVPNMPLLLALGLVGFSCAGYFALAALSKAGFSSPMAEYAILACAFFAFFASAISRFALPTASALIFLPIMFSIPAVLSLARVFAAKLSG